MTNPFELKKGFSKQGQSYYDQSTNGYATDKRHLPVMSKYISTYQGFDGNTTKMYQNQGQDQNEDKKIFIQTKSVKNLDSIIKNYCNS